MADMFNIYCDESCHLEHDGHKAMLLGAVSCRQADMRKISKDLRSIKKRFRATAEMKWVKVSPAKLDFYREILAYFYGNPSLEFRCLCLYDKKKTGHSYFNQQDHDSFYYLMYYTMLREMVLPDGRYNIYIDIKDTRSQRKIEALKERLCRHIKDPGKRVIERVQHIRARESEILQLTDFLLGAISYSARGHVGSPAKQAIVEGISSAMGLELPESTPPWERKFNLHCFTPPEPPKAVEHA